jgi:hypothetical protein
MPLTLLRDIADSTALPRMYKRRSDLSRLVMYRAFGYISAVIPEVDEGTPLPAIVIAVLPAGHRALGRLCPVAFGAAPDGPAEPPRVAAADDRPG